jgi:hypothetical protein
MSETKKCPQRTIAVSERLLRREAVENSIADLRLEGLAPTADAQLLFEQFVQGELTEEQLELTMNMIINMRMVNHPL